VSTPKLIDLFEESCDPQTYIPRRASEDVLRCLSSLLRDDEPVMLLHGPAGIGKSMLLRVLGERFESERRVAYVSVTDSPEPELCHRILDLLSEPAAEDPAQALIRAATAADTDHPRLLLLIDHANLAPIASSLQLVSAAQAAAPRLSVIFAVADDRGAEEFARALSAQGQVTTLCFSQSMDPQEATAYVRLRLARTQMPAQLRGQLDSRAVRWLSEGAQAALPREINRRASQLLKSYEEGGEAALDFSLEAAESAPPREPQAIDPSEIPTDEPGEPQPPAVPMTPADSAPPNPAAASGSGSLGTMLLGHGPGTRPNLEIDLELGRSLGSGLLEAAAPERSFKDGQPVLPPPVDPVADTERTDPGSQTAASQSNHAGLAITSLIALVIASGYLATRIPSRIGQGEASIAAESRAARAEFDAAALAGESELADAIEPLARRTKATRASDDATLSAAPSLTADLETPALNARPELLGSNPRPSLVEGPLLESTLLVLEAKARGEATIMAASTEKTPASVQAPPTPEPQPAPQPAAPPSISHPTPSKPAAPGPIVLPSRADSAETRAASYVRLSIDVEPGSEVTVDGQSIGIAPFSAIFIEVGTHTFVVETQEGIRVEQLVDVQVGTDIVEF
jgi:hypothetical protein